MKINEAHVGGDLEISVNERASPPTAQAGFTGRFSFKLVRGTSPYNNLVRRFQVKFVKEQDRWLITGVEETTSDGDSRLGPVLFAPRAGRRVAGRREYFCVPWIQLSHMLI